MWSLLKTFWEAVPYCSFQRPSHSQLQMINISYVGGIAFEVDTARCITMRKHATSPPLTNNSRSALCVREGQMVRRLGQVLGRRVSRRSRSRAGL
jgi:hypothetical protein